MLCKTSGVAIFAIIGLLGQTAGSAHAAEPVATMWDALDGTLINLGGLPGFTSSIAYGVAPSGLAVGESVVGGVERATEFAFGQGAVELGGLVGSGSSVALSMNDLGQSTGYSVLYGSEQVATEWDNFSGTITNLQGDMGGPSVAFSINSTGISGAVVGFDGQEAVEWSGGGVIDLGEGKAFANNDNGDVVGESGGSATEWSGGKVINLGGLTGSTSSEALAINNNGQVVGYSVVDGVQVATEWSGGKVINLGGLPGSTSSEALGINFNGEVVGYSVVGGVDHATEWSGGNVINLGGLPGSISSEAYAVDDAGQVVGYSMMTSFGSPQPAVPEPSTWAMMLLGFAGLGLAGYRRAKAMG